MAAIDQIININISQAGVAVPTTGTTVPLIVGTTVPDWAKGDVVHSYSDVSGMLSDGFKSTDPEYLAALALTSQNSVPSIFLVGRRSGTATAATPQVDHVSVETLEAPHVYSFKADGQIFSYTTTDADTDQTVLMGLAASVTAVTGATVTAKIDGAALVLTGKVAGAKVTYTEVDANLAQATDKQPTASEAEQLNAADLEAITAQDGSWYCLVTVNANDDEILETAKWVQSRRKFYVPITKTPDALDAQVKDDVASLLNDGSFTRTMAVWSDKSFDSHLNAAWVGDQICQTPGSNNWAFRTLAGQLPDSLTDAQQLAAIGSPVSGIQGKNLNIYQKVGGVPLTQMGTCGGGQYADITVGLDWLFFNLQSSVYSTLVNTPGKVPFTDAGVALLLSAVRQVIDTGVNNGLIDGLAKITVDAAKVSTVSKQQKASRRSPTITFTCTLQGAINSVKVNGSVSV